MAVAERDLTVAENAAPIPWRCSREPFYQMGELGWFEGQRVMLIGGEILAMPAMGNWHRATVTLASQTLRAVFGDGFFVCERSPFETGEATDPEPDIAVIAGQIRDYANRGLTEAALIVEVSDSTLDYDRREKAPLNARAGVQEYWIINLKASQVEVHRQPLPPEQSLGLGYTDIEAYRKGQSLQALAANGANFSVSDLLP